MDLEAHLFSLEQALQQSTTRSDAAQLERLLADDFVEFGASGNVWGSKAQVIAGLQDEAFSARRMTEFAVKALSDGVALVTYRGYRRRRAIVAQFSVAAGRRAVADGVPSRHAGVTPRHKD